MFIIGWIVGTAAGAFVTVKKVIDKQYADAYPEMCHKSSLMYQLEKRNERNRG
jgi:hypothetical protein